MWRILKWGYVSNAAVYPSSFTQNSRFSTFIVLNENQLLPAEVLTYVTAFYSCLLACQSVLLQLTMTGSKRMIRRRQ